MKFLTDSQINFVLVKMLRSLGWAVDTVYDHNLQSEPNDARLVAWTHTHRMVFVTFDEMRSETGKLVAGQIREYGGKVIQIRGGPQQPPDRAAGKLLFHREKWYPFLRENDGQVIIHDLKQACETVSREKMQANRTELLQPQFEQYLEGKKQARRRKIKRRPRRVPDEQKRLLKNGGA